MYKSAILVVAVCAAFACSFALAQEQPEQAAGVATEATTPEASGSVSSGDYKFDESAVRKKHYSVGGFAEFRPVLNGLSSGSAYYKMNFYNRPQGGALPEYNLRTQLDGALEKGIARLFLRGNLSTSNTYQGWSNDSKLYEGYLALKPTQSWSIDLGKKAFKWGKGYAWNPVGFLDRPKDPTDPDLALEGYWAASAQYLRSFHGSLKTFSLSAAIVPVFYRVYGNTGLNDTFAGPQLNALGTSPQPTSNQTNVAAKAYFLFRNTDIDLVYFTGQTKTDRYGVDFSRNLGPRLEVHGEFATVMGFQRKTVDTAGNLHSSTYNAVSYLLGFRFLTKKLTTYIFEYYRNEAGFTTTQTDGYFSYVDRAYNTYASTGNVAAIQKAANLAAGNYGKISPMQDYLYLRISQDQPFGKLYYTPAISSIVDLDTRSLQLVPELVSTRYKNWELRGRVYLPIGGKHTEFGEKQNVYRAEVRVRRFF